jgi:hypothetical protein
MKLSAACRKVSRCAIVAWRKKNIFREILTDRNCGLQKEVTASRRNITHCAGHRHMARNKRKGPECNTGIRDRRLRQQLQGRNLVEDLGGGQLRYLKNVEVESMANFYMNFTKTARLEIAKRIIGSSVGLRQDKDWTLWRGRPPPKRKKLNSTWWRNR